MKTISLRIKSGWIKTQNKGKDTCDTCSAKLWIAPHGGIYCDREHEV